VTSSFLIAAGNMIAAFVLFRIGNALLESYPGLTCIEGPCKGFSGSFSEEFPPLSPSSSSTTRFSQWGPDVGWFFSVAALGPSIAALFAAVFAGTPDR
jgi:hypothetical protein